MSKVSDSSSRCHLHDCRFWWVSLALPLGKAYIDTRRMYIQDGHGPSNYIYYCSIHYNAYINLQGQTECTCKSPALSKSRYSSYSLVELNVKPVLKVSDFSSPCSLHDCRLFRESIMLCRGARAIKIRVGCAYRLGMAPLNTLMECMTCYIMMADFCS